MIKKLRTIGERGDDISTSTFDEALSEVWKLMEDHVYREFLKSKYAQFYLHMKKNDITTLNQLHMGLLDREDLSDDDDTVPVC